MIAKKAGTILLNMETKQIGLIYREGYKDCGFPKGHLERGETLQECAIRETEEETMRSNHLIINEEIYVLKYMSSVDEETECYFYIAVDDGPTSKNIALKDREILEWTNIEDVEDKLSYENYKKLWNKIKKPIIDILDNDGNITPDILNDLGI